MENIILPRLLSSILEGHIHILSIQRFKTILHVGLISTRNFSNKNCEVGPCFWYPSFLCTRVGFGCALVVSYCTFCVSCCTHVVSCCLVFYSCWLMLRRVVIYSYCVVSFCTRVVSCCLVLLSRSYIKQFVWYNLYDSTSLAM